MNQLLDRKPESAVSGDEGPHQKKKNGPDWAELRRRGAVEWKNLKEWSRIHFRRAAHIARNSKGYKYDHVVDACQALAFSGNACNGYILEYG